MSFPYPILRVAGTGAIEKLMYLRSQSSGTPVLLGSPDAFERVVENMEVNGEGSTEDLIAAARALDVHEWLAARKAEDEDYYEIDTSAWPEDAQPPNTALVSHQDILSRAPYAEVVLCAIPAPEAWMVPCYLRTGNWNSVPRPEEHAALFRHWEEKYGARVACITDDVIELTVEQPPASREEAMILAEQQYIYCADIVHQGVGSLKALAATLLGSTVWYFWWD